MVKAGLKVGDTFEDGGRIYTVTKVLPNGNYVSTAKAEVPVAEVSKPTQRTSKAT